MLKCVLTIVLLLPVSGGIFAAKKMLILDFRNLDHDPNYEYLESLLTDGVRKAIQQKFEILEPDPADVAKRAKDGYLLFAEDFHNKNVALQLGVLTGQDIVLSGGFSKKSESSIGSVILIEVLILDIENARLAKRLNYAIKVDGNIFSSVDSLAEKIASEAKSVLPNKGRFDFDRHAPFTTDQLAVYAGYNLNGAFPTLRKHPQMDSGSRIAPADLGGLMVSAEYRHDRFLGLNRFIGFVRADMQWMNSAVGLVNSSETATIKGTGFTGEIGLGYQVIRYKKFFLNLLAGGGGTYSRFSVDMSSLKNLPLDTRSGEASNSFSGTIYGPTASAGFRTGIQLTPYISWEIGAVYQATFLQGSFSGNVITMTGLGLRI